MAENELDGFDNLDDLFSEEKQGGEAAAAAGGDIDQLLGDAPAEGGEATEGGGASDSELDSFFEDLSTIDDLEVTQEEAPAAPPPAEEPAAEAAPEPAPRRAAAPAAPKAKKKGGRFKRMVTYLVVIGIAGAAGYWFLIPSEEVPWEVEAPEEQMEVPVQEEQAPEPPPPPKPQPQPVRPAPPPQPEPQPPPQAKPAPARPSVTYSIQVATCFFPNCVQDFQKRLKEMKIDSRVRAKTRTRETLEIYSEPSFASRDTAQQMAERINRENRMEGQAYVIQQGGGFRISMGNFTDLGRANIVRDALNQRMAGEVSFTTRVKNLPYKLHYVLGGKYGSKASAEAARNKLVSADSRFSDSFVIRN